MASEPTNISPSPWPMAKGEPFARSDDQVFFAFKEEGQGKSAVKTG